MARAAELAPSLVDAILHPPARPLAVRGHSGCGKTRLIRRVVQEIGIQSTWATAFDLTATMTDAVREGRYDLYRAGFTTDRRPLCIEHLEDLRGKPVTRKEVRRLLQARATSGCPTLLTITTNSRGDGEVLEWLAPWTELCSLE